MGTHSTHRTIHLAQNGRRNRLGCHFSLSDTRPQLSALAAILRHGSFEAAAQELHVTQSAISQRLKALEERAGTPLVLRGAPCEATPAGRRLQRHAQELSLLEARVSQDLGLSSETARVRIAVNADSLATWIIPALASQDLIYEIEVDDQDHSSDWLREGAVSAAVTARSQPVQGCDCISLGAMDYVATASPSFMTRRFPDGVTLAALKQAPMLTFNNKDRLQLSWVERHFGQRLRLPTHLLPSTQGFVDASLAGLGWGLNPKALVEPHMKSGKLVAVLPDATTSVPLYWQVARHVSQPLTPLTRAIRRAASNGMNSPLQVGQ